MPLNFFSICTYGGYCLTQKIYIYNHAIKLPIKTLYQILLIQKVRKNYTKPIFISFVQREFVGFLIEGKREIKFYVMLKIGPN